jgi:hypothetical protein
MKASKSFATLIAQNAIFWQPMRRLLAFVCLIKSQRLCAVVLIKSRESVFRHFPQVLNRSPLN